jgi:O-antigen ligase
MLALIGVLALALLLSFSRGAWIALAIAGVLYGGLRILTAPTRARRLKLMVLALLGAGALALLLLGALQIDGIAKLFDERVALTHSYDEGPEGRFGGQEKAAALVLQHPFGIGAQQFAPHYHHEEPHNVYLAVFLNSGWLGGFIFLALILATAFYGMRHALVRTASQPIFLVAYACFVGHALEGLLIDFDHWRHFYLLLALVWGMMLARRPLVLLRSS